MRGCFSYQCSDSAPSATLADDDDPTGGRQRDAVRDVFESEIRDRPAEAPERGVAAADSSCSPVAIQPSVGGARRLSLVCSDSPRTYADPGRRVLCVRHEHFVRNADFAACA